MPTAPGFNPSSIPVSNAHMMPQPGSTLSALFLMARSGVFIKQRLDYAEVISGCETKNKYYVYLRDQSGTKLGNPILKCKEHSGWCARNCIAANCRPFKMRVQNLWNQDRMCLEMERDCQPSCACFNRPQMKVFYTETNQREYIGKIVDNFDFCNLSFDIVDSEGNIRFYIIANRCQCGILCKQCPGQECEKVKFEIYSGDKKLKLQPLIKAGKKSCIKNYMGDADNFSIPFPPDCSFSDQVLLMSCSLFIDYLMFEEDDKKGARNY